MATYGAEDQPDEHRSNVCNTHPHPHPHPHPHQTPTATATGTATTTPTLTPTHTQTRQNGEDFASNNAYVRSIVEKSSYVQTSTTTRRAMAHYDSIEWLIASADWLHCNGIGGSVSQHIVSGIPVSNGNKSRSPGVNAFVLVKNGI